VGARLADPSSRISTRVSKAAVADTGVERLERAIDRLEVELPPLRRFILPGGSEAGSRLHVARTICRRAERRVVALGAGAVERPAIVYLNRLSDLLFVMARVANHRAGVADVEW
jgi:cob(I)alamin adenosyltransferase